MRPAEPDTRPLTLAAAGLFLAVVLVRPSPLALFGTDAACYARIARELAARPLSSWVDLRWDAGAFHEHPPLGLWLEAAWFRLFGPSAAAAVWLARLYALALGVLVHLTARRLAGPAFAALSLVALVAMPDFVLESQNPMLEPPLTLAFAGALYAATRLPHSARAAVGFALAVLAAAWVKGVVALAALPLLAWALVAGAPPRRVAGALALCVGLLLATAAGYEAWCRAEGVVSFFSDYARRQVAVSLVEGRGRPVADPLYYVRVLASWQLPLLLALPLVALGWRRLDPARRSLVALALLHAVVVVAGFSIARQKNPWYLAPVLPASAWVVAAALSTPARWLGRLLAPAVALAGVGWLVFVLGVGTRADTAREAAIRAVTASRLDAGGAAVANCAPVGDWEAEHLFAFHWNARAVPCDAPAAWRFDGKTPTFVAP